MYRVFAKEPHDKDSLLADLSEALAAKLVPPPDISIPDDLSESVNIWLSPLIQAKLHNRRGRTGIALYASQLIAAIRIFRSGDAETRALFAQLQADEEAEKAAKVARAAEEAAARLPKTVEFDAIVTSTEHAVLIDFGVDYARPIWFPKRRITLDELAKTITCVAGLADVKLRFERLSYLSERVPLAQNLATKPAKSLRLDGFVEDGRSEYRTATKRPLVVVFRSRDLEDGAPTREHAYTTILAALKAQYPKDPPSRHDGRVTSVLTTSVRYDDLILMHDWRGRDFRG